MDNFETYFGYTEAWEDNCLHSSEIWFSDHQTPKEFGGLSELGDLIALFTTVSLGDSFDLTAEALVEGNQLPNADSFDHSFVMYYCVAPAPIAHINSFVGLDLNGLPPSPRSALMDRCGLMSLTELPLANNELHEFRTPTNISALSAKSVGLVYAADAKLKPYNLFSPIGSKIAVFYGGLISGLHKRLQFGSQATTKKRHVDMDSAIIPDVLSVARKLCSKDDQKYSDYSEHCSTMTVPQLQTELQNHVRQLGTGAGVGSGAGGSFTFGISAFWTLWHMRGYGDVLRKSYIVQNHLSA
jgi:hypothetical protein